MLNTYSTWGDGAIRRRYNGVSSAGPTAGDAIESYSRQGGNEYRHEVIGGAIRGEVLVNAATE